MVQYSWSLSCVLVIGWRWLWKGKWGPVQRALKDVLRCVDFHWGSFGEPWRYLGKEVTWGKNTLSKVDSEKAPKSYQCHYYSDFLNMEVFWTAEGKLMTSGNYRRFHVIHHFFQEVFLDFLRLLDLFPLSSSTTMHFFVLWYVVDHAAVTCLHVYIL